MSVGESVREQCLFVIFGGTGDLARRKIMPALYELERQERARKTFRVLGVARDRSLDDAAYRDWVKEGLAREDSSGDVDAWVDGAIFYEGIGKGTEGFHALSERIRALEDRERLPGNRVFYIALPPGAFATTIGGLAEAGLNRSEGWTRLVVEKPFGKDLSSARELNQLIHQWFDESQVYRIDHYLGKETVQNLLVLRFANAFFESLWNRNHVGCVEITVAEDLGVERRAAYYERAGALRDMVQNHLAQLLALVAMEVPSAFEADAIRTEKTKVLRSVGSIRPDDVVLGQYAAGESNGDKLPAYRDELDVAPDSSTETFAALRLDVDTWRWRRPLHSANW